MIIRRPHHRTVFCEPFDDEGSSGGGPDLTPAPAPAPAAPPAAAPAGPSSMLEAISQGLEQGAAPAASPAVAAGQPRDDQGRFTFKDAAGNAVDAQGQPAPDQAAALAAQAAAAAPAAKLGADGKPLPVVPGADDDLLQMPEGLGQKAQQRFQTLANTNRELTERADVAERQVAYVKESFQANAVQPEQFEQAVSVIGMINKGDLAGAQKVLLEQLQQLSLLGGLPMPEVDPLAEFPDLRQRVNGLMLAEEDAIEMARARKVQQLQQQGQQRQQQATQQQRSEQQAQQAQQQAVQQAQTDVDTFCKQMKAQDLDYDVIEAQLLPVLKDILQDQPPARWPALVQAQYKLIKNVAGTVRQQSGGASTQALRATGQASPAAAPKTMHEAMWGNG